MGVNFHLLEFHTNKKSALSASNLFSFPQDLECVVWIYYSCPYLSWMNVKKLVGKFECTNIETKLVFDKMLASK